MAEIDMLRSNGLLGGSPLMNEQDTRRDASDVLKLNGLLDESLVSITASPGVSYTATSNFQASGSAQGSCHSFTRLLPKLRVARR
jgi:hypothetical protein